MAPTAGTNDYLEITYGYDHHDDVKNPAFGASQSVYVQCILMPDIVGFPGYLRFSGLSESYVSSASRDIKTTSNNLWFNQSYGFYFVQPNQYPRFAYSESWGTETPIEFFYTE